MQTRARATLDGLYALPDNQKAELIGGKLALGMPIFGLMPNIPSLYVERRDIFFVPFLELRLILRSAGFTRCHRTSARRVDARLAGELESKPRAQAPVGHFAARQATTKR